MVDFQQIEAGRRHWYQEEHFARQLGNASARAVVENRWRVFRAALDQWLADPAGGGTLATDAAIRVLDAGCGDGINLVGLTRMFEAVGRRLDLLGLDYNELRVERARGLGLDCRLEVGSLLETGLPAASIDLALLNHVLEHIPDKAPVLAELRRVMRPGALLIVGVPNEGCALAGLRNHVLQRSILRTTDHVHFFTAATLRRDLSAAGFGVDRVEREGFFLPHQRIAGLIGASGSGRRALTGLGRLLPSQAAGLIAIAHAGRVG